jgi:ribosomal protein L11 methyltransferase
MIYKAVHFTLSPYSREFSEVLIALLDAYRFEGIVEEDANITAFIPDELLEEETLEELKDTLSALNTSLSWVIEVIPEQNWNKLWESNFEPVVIDDKCAIRAPFHPDFNEVKYQITIEPKMAFGTGHHQTTRLMLEQIMLLDLQRKKVLDMGCGTGVLGILASMCGAAEITAIDIDSWSFENTIENAMANNIHNIAAIKGGREAIPNKIYDVVLANINRNILLDQMHDYARVTTTGAILLLSGILNTDVEIICNSALEAGFSFVHEKVLGSWILLMFKRK